MQASEQDRATAETIELIRRFDDAINRRDLEAVMALVTDDIVWETTTPPDGIRVRGREDVRREVAAFFASSPALRFEEEELVVVGDRAVLTWKYHWKDAEGNPGHVRGVDLIRVRDGKVAETIAYVKG